MWTRTRASSSRRDAPVQLGVGKNMVRAIRFWGLAAKLIAENSGSLNRRSPDLVPTGLGHQLFGESGWDQYMEDPGTLWLLHWLLLAPPSRLPVWWLAFNEFHAVEFADDDLEEAAIVQLGAVAGWAAPHPSSVKKDVSALLRTYAPAERSGRTGIDDILDCPLRELNLIGRSAATDHYRFTLGAKPTPAVGDPGLRRLGLHRPHQHCGRHGNTQSPYPRAGGAGEGIQAH